MTLTCMLVTRPLRCGQHRHATPPTIRQAYCRHELHPVFKRRHLYSGREQRRESKHCHQHLRFWTAQSSGRSLRFVSALTASFVHVSFYFQNLILFFLRTKTDGMFFLLPPFPTAVKELCLPCSPNHCRTQLFSGKALTENGTGNGPHCAPATPHSLFLSKA